MLANNNGWLIHCIAQQNHESNTFTFIFPVDTLLTAQPIGLAMSCQLVSHNIIISKYYLFPKRFRQIEIDIDASHSRSYSLANRVQVQ